METPLNVDPSASSSTATVITNIHNMPWLKQDSSSQNSKIQPCVGKDGQILSAKKTDEDYFPGTREEKKGKKRKEKKGKSGVPIRNLEDLIHLTQHCEKIATPVQDFQEIAEYTPSSRRVETQLVSYVAQNTANNSVWSTTTSTADKLFPNVHSVVIDRLEEEEMYSRAIAESIATIQLEQFNKPSPVKEDRWESLYGDDDEDDGGWNNTKRNLPPPETMESRGEDVASGQRKNCDDNNNSSKTGGILRNQQENANQYSLETAELDFGFKKVSESSKDEVTASQSTKSVSFNELISVKVRSSESSENDECEKTSSSNKKEPFIDKYGRVDGYAERRLFMGKGARLREMEFIQNRCSLGVGNTQCQNFGSNSKTTAIVKTEKLAVTDPQCSKNLPSEKTILNLEKSKADREIAVKKVHQPPETRVQKFESNPPVTTSVEIQKSMTTTSQSPENSQLETPIPNPEEPKTEREIAVKNFHRPPDTRQEKLESDSQAITIIETRESLNATSQCSKDVQSKECILDSEKPKTLREIGVKNLHKPPEPRHEKFKSDSQVIEVIRTKKPVQTTSQYHRNSQSQRSVPDLKSPKAKNEGGVKNAHRTPDIPKNGKQIVHDTEKLTELVISSPVEASLPKSLIVTHNSTVDNARRSCNKRSPSVELKLEKTELKPIKNNAQTMKRTENLKTPHNTVHKTSDGRGMKERQINPYKDELVSPGAKAITSDNKNPIREIDNLSQRPEIPSEEAAEDLEENVLISEDVMSKNLAAVLKVVNNGSEEESESQGRCLVPTLVRQDEYMPDFPPINFEYEDSTADMLDTEFQNPAYRNLLLAGVSCSDLSCDAQSSMTRDFDSQNLQNQNYSIQTSIPLNTLPLQSQTFNNMHHFQPECINSGEQIYQTAPISQITNLNTNTNSVLPNYLNTANKPQMDQTDYANFLRNLGPQNLPYQSIALLMNPDNFNSPSFMESRENFFSGNNIEDIPSYERTGDDGRQFLLRTPPGLAKNVQLPPGFTKKNLSQRDDADKDDRLINPLTVIESVKDVKSKPKKQRKKKSKLGSTNNCGEATSGNPAQSKPAYGERNTTPSTVQNNRASFQKNQNHYKSHNRSARQESNSTENRKVPYPILGAAQNSHEKCSNSKNDQCTQSPKLERGAVIIQPSNTSKPLLNTGDDNVRESSMGTSSANNNYLPSSTQSIITDFDRQGMNLPAIVPQSGLPFNYQIPVPNMANWQYNVNLSNSPQVPMGFVPNCQIPVTNHHNFPVNASGDYFNAPIYQNVRYQQLPMHMLNQAQIPMYTNPPGFNAEGNDLQNGRLENIESFQLNSISNHDPFVEMQRSMMGAPSCGNYNLNETPMGQFMSNSTFYKTGTIPNAQDPWSVHDNQSNNTTGQIFDNVKTSRGRGRLIKKSLS